MALLSGDLYCERCGSRYLHRADPEHCSECARGIGAGEARRSWTRYRRYLCEDCAERQEWE
ncbi:MAG: hypothetical protein GXY82_00290 [Methanospirillum sp.]|nr:hypothetical protein [Methanospirillum sp.]